MSGDHLLGAGRDGTALGSWVWPPECDGNLRFVSPDTTACIFWLKNRNPEEWRDKMVQELTWASKKPSEMTNEELDAAYLALQALLPSPATVN